MIEGDIKILNSTATQDITDACQRFYSYPIAPKLYSRNKTPMKVPKIDSREIVS